MANRILTTHVGSLPRPAKFLEVSQKRTLGEKFDEAAYETGLKEAVAEVVRKQKEAGVDLINDGKLAHTMGWAYDYGSWWSYVIRRLDGVEVTDTGLWFTKLSAHTKTPMAPKDFIVGDWGERRDMSAFQEAYLDPQSGCGLPEQFMTNHSPLVKGPIKYKGQELIARDIANLKAGLKAAGLGTEGAWMNSIAPASCARMPNEYYKSEEELLYACADAVREEYKAIIDAGFIVQLDDPAIGENWDQQKNEPSVEGYRRYTRMQIDALNHAIKGLPSSKIRFHLCWGSWHGPHTTDIPMTHLVDLMLAVNADYYSFEAANARHEHEWKLWKDIKLPAGKKILPGVVTHSTNLIEHPELVADRICRFAEAVGPENVIASTDCGLGGRVHPQIAWAKLKALAQGAELASKRLYAKKAA
ncbi:MAG: cobalamin-independent methionine synthase II family protein [Xanthobacteraceae bacterium]|nr:cobalamin-independent methionine synthase II family protein [Xanthobacteraceae bacterium]